MEGYQLDHGLVPVRGLLYLMLLSSKVGPSGPSPSYDIMLSSCSMPMRAVSWVLRGGGGRTLTSLSESLPLSDSWMAAQTQSADNFWTRTTIKSEVTWVPSLHWSWTHRRKDCRPPLRWHHPLHLTSADLDTARWTEPGGLISYALAPLRPHLGRVLAGEEAAASRHHHLHLPNPLQHPLPGKTSR